MFAGNAMEDNVGSNYYAPILSMSDYVSDPNFESQMALKQENNPEENFFGQTLTPGDGFNNLSSSYTNLDLYTANSNQPISNSLSPRYNRNNNSVAGAKPKMRFSPDVNWEMQVDHRDRSHTWPRKPVELVDITDDNSGQAIGAGGDSMTIGDNASTSGFTNEQDQSESFVNGAVSYYNQPPANGLDDPSPTEQSIDQVPPFPQIINNNNPPAYSSASYGSYDSGLNSTSIGGGGEMTINNPSSGRRNPWGNQSYADLITIAIMNAPEQRLTLSQVYEWFIKNVPFFTERSDTAASAGWKNEESGKSSWWTCSTQIMAQQEAQKAAQCSEQNVMFGGGQMAVGGGSGLASPSQSEYNNVGNGHIGPHKRHRRRAATDISNGLAAAARDRVRAKLGRGQGSGDEPSSNQYLDPLQIDMNFDANALRRAQSSLSDSKQSLVNGHSPSPASPGDFKPNYTTMPLNKLNFASADGIQPAVAELIQSATDLQLQSGQSSQSPPMGAVLVNGQMSAQQQINCYFNQLHAPLNQDFFSTPTQQVASTSGTGAYDSQNTDPTLGGFLSPMQGQGQSACENMNGSYLSAGSPYNAQQVSPQPQFQLSPMHPGTAAPYNYTPYAQPQYSNGMMPPPVTTTSQVQFNAPVSVAQSVNMSDLCDMMPVQSPLWQTGTALTCDIGAILNQEKQYGGTFDFTNVDEMIAPRNGSQ